MKNILFRCDYGSVYGLGHLMRCLKLANQFKQKDYNCIFITFPNKIINKILISNGHKIFNIKNNKISVNEDFKWTNIENKLTIVDTIKINNSYLNKINQKNLLCFFETEYKKKIKCKFILNNNIWIKKNKYNQNNDSIYFLGPKYNVIPEDYFLNPKKNNNNLIITMGGDDSHNMTYKILNTLDNFDKFQKIYIVLGHFHPNPKSIQNICQKKLLNYEIIIRPNNLLGLYKKCGFAISSASTTIYELIAAKIPFSYFVLQHSQKKFKDYLNKIKLGVYLGDARTTDMLLKSNFNKFISINKNDQIKKCYKIMSESGSSKLVDELIRYID